MKLPLLICYALARLLGANLPLNADSVTVFAAASLTDSMKEIADSYQRATGDRVVLNFGASSTLARQIEEGAPADLLVSADASKMDALDKRGLVEKETRKSRLSNSLVIVLAADSTLALKNVHALTYASVKRIALADPKAVPAGIYTRQHLDKTGLWSVLEKKVVPTDNVRAAVESGNIEAAIVDKTDANISSTVKVVCETPVAEGPAISYPMALLKGARRPEAARRFLKRLASDEAGRVFAKSGVIVLP